MIAFEQVGDTDHHIKGSVVVAAIGKGAAMQGVTQVEEIQFRKPVALLKGSKGMELLAGGPANGGAGLLLLEQGSKQGEGSVEDGEQGKRRMALKGSDLLAQRWGLGPDRGMPSPASPRHIVLRIPYPRWCPEAV